MVLLDFFRLYSSLAVQTPRLRNDYHAFTLSMMSMFMRRGALFFFAYIIVRQSGAVKNFSALFCKYIVNKMRSIRPFLYILIDNRAARRIRLKTAFKV